MPSSRLEWLPRFAELGIPLVVGGAIEGAHADLVHLDVVGVRIAGVVVVVGDEHVRAFLANHLHESTDGFVHVRHVEARGICVRGRIEHARVAIAEHLDAVEADDLGRLGELEWSQRGEQCLLFVTDDLVERLSRVAHRRVGDVALLPARAAHEDGACAFGSVLGHRRSTL